MLQHDIEPNLLSHSAAVTCSGTFGHSGRIISHCGLLESQMLSAFWSSWKMPGVGVDDGMIQWDDSGWFSIFLSGIYNIL